LEHVLDTLTDQRVWLILATDAGRLAEHRDFSYCEKRFVRLPTRREFAQKLWVSGSNGPVERSDCDLQESLRVSITATSSRTDQIVPLGGST